MVFTTPEHTASVRRTDTLEEIAKLHLEQHSDVTDIHFLDPERIIIVAHSTEANAVELIYWNYITNTISDYVLPDIAFDAVVVLDQELDRLTIVQLMSIDIYDAQTLAQLHSFPNVLDRLEPVYLSADDSLMVYAGGEVVDVESGEYVGQLDTGRVNFLGGFIDGTVSSQHLVFSSPSRGGAVVFFAFGLEQWKNEACRIANRNLTANEWQAFFGSEPYRETCVEREATPPMIFDIATLTPSIRFHSTPTFTPQPTLIATQQPTEASVQILEGIVNSQGLNVRTEPTINSFDVASLVYGDHVQLVGRNTVADWVEIETQSRRIRGWVNARYLYVNEDILLLPVTTTNVGNESSPISSPTTRIIATVETPGDTLNVRNGPGAGYEVIGELAHNSSITVVGRNGSASWVQVDGFANGWVNSRFLTGSDWMSLPHMTGGIFLDDVD